MNKLLLLMILTCLVLIVCSAPSVDSEVIDRDRRSPCGAGGCALYKSIAFGKKPPFKSRFGSRKGGSMKNYFSRFNSKRFQLPDDDFYLEDKND
ncbi:hypothetical protein P5673_013155 [Acropora cervicornis]|uniref:Uncharacterized protein n=1 Tax=Acropora cervicornis TaxID=6130 RepID=A0AAD9V6Y5_ACRCE|nr:hypothetical protein P5673_013155 [Acropora cervicornis]